MYSLSLSLPNVFTPHSREEDRERAKPIEKRAFEHTRRVIESPVLRPVKTPYATRKERTLDCQGPFKTVYTEVRGHVYACKVGKIAKKSTG